MKTSIAVVTGASRGIGRAIAWKLAQQGHQVWALARSQEALTELQKAASSLPGPIWPWVMDAENPDSVLSATRSILQKGTPSILVNNAGIAISAPLEKTDNETFARVMAVNVTTPFILCRELMPRMAAQGFGRVIQIASTAAIKGFKYTSAYCASKHALLGMTRSLALEYATQHVTVNAVCPGWTDTDMLKAAALNISKTTGRTEEESRAALAKLSPMKRPVTPEEVASVCSFLASEDAAAITGSAYVIDGGESA